MIRPILASLAIALFAVAAHAADPLIDFESDDIMQRVNNLDSTAELIQHDGSTALKVTLGHERPYPNVTFDPEGGKGGSWDLSDYTGIAIEVTNVDDVSIKLGCRVDNPGATGRKNSNNGSVTIEPGRTETLTVYFERKFATELSDQLTGMHYSPWGKRGVWGGSIDPAHVVSINLFMNKPVRDHTIVVDNIRPIGTFDPSSLTVPEPFFPFVDTYGQYIHRDWPDKVHSDEDLAAQREREAESIETFPRPKNWNKYGGWANGPQLEATGHFYATKHEGKWYLVDPEGRLFFSMGIDVVKPGGATPVTEDRATWFKNPPWVKPSMLEHIGEGKPKRGEYAKRQTVTEFHFYKANLERKYGDDWRQTWLDITPKRLMNWGFNTIGCWSEADLFENTQTPYTHWVYINSAKLPWQPGSRNRISDPFNPMLEKEMRRRAQAFAEPFKDDPMCIGFFVDNELSWGEQDFLAKGVVERGKPNLYAKQAFADWLKDKYDTVNALNSAWGINLKNWDAFKTSNQLPTTDSGHDDLVAFNAVIVEEYFKTVRGVMKEVAPDKLYLGCRFAESNPQVVKIAAEYTDVLSFNLYRDTVGAWAIPSEGVDRPVIIGEFHFGASDRGVFGSGLVKAKSAEDRAVKFEKYMRSAADNPVLVGAHWFALVDEPVSGRTLEGENHGFGFLTITDTPYPEMIEASRRVATDLYTHRTGD